MDDADIRLLIESGDSDPVPEAMEVRYVLTYRGGGMFHSWNVKGADGAAHIAKFPSHEQPPGHRLAIELAVGRLGGMISPAVTPRVAVLELRDSHIRGKACRECAIPLAAGHLFGSRQVDHSQQVKGGQIPPLIPSHTAAAIVGFQMWLQGEDVHILHSATGEAYSIDHAAFLTGASDWDAHGRPTPTIVLPGWSDLAADARLNTPECFQPFVHQLTALPQERIVAAFGGMPPGWSGTIDERVIVAAYALARRDLLAGVIRSTWSRSLP